MPCFFYILAIFLPVFCLISAAFMLFLRSSPFANPLLSDKSAFYLTANHYHSEGRREAEGRQKGSRTEAERPHDLFAAFWHPAAFVSIFASLTLCYKGNGSMAQGEGLKMPIWGIAENCAILRSATMAFAKSRWQRWIFCDCLLHLRETIQRNVFLLALRLSFAVGNTYLCKVLCVLQLSACRL